MTDTAAPTQAAIIAPAPGSRLSAAVQVFRWDLGGIPVESAWLFVGDSEGGSQYASRSVGAATSISVGLLPTDGSDVFARLWYKTGGQWMFLDERYIAPSAPGLPAIVDPTPDATLTNSRVRFQWSVGEVPVESWWLYVGSTVGGSDFSARSAGTDDNATIQSLPTGGSTIHVRLYFRVEGWWYYIDEQYKAAVEMIPTKDELTRELQELVGVEADGDIGRLTRAALNQNWLGLTSAFDASFAERFTNAEDLVTWVQRRINTRSEAGLALTGEFGPEVETAVIEHLDRSGIVAAESFIALLDA